MRAGVLSEDMKIVFVDETSDSARKDYHGICCALVDSYAYKAIKEEAQDILKKSGWDTDIEFKGSMLFSASTGDTRIPIEKRVEIASSLIKLNTSTKNSRIKFAYCDFVSRTPIKSYLECLPPLLERLLPKAPPGPGKDILALYCDEHSGLSQDAIRIAIKPVLNKKGFTLLEDVVLARSNFETIGVMYADLVAYLFGRREIISKDKALPALTADQRKTDGRVRKLESSKELLSLVKDLKAYEADL